MTFAHLLCSCRWKRKIFLNDDLTFPAGQHATLVGCCFLLNQNCISVQSLVDEIGHGEMKWPVDLLNLPTIILWITLPITFMSPFWVRTHLLWSGRFLWLTLRASLVAEKLRKLFLKFLEVWCLSTKMHQSKQTDSHCALSKNALKPLWVYHNYTP